MGGPQPTTAPEPTLGKALHYPPEQWPYLLRCLEGGRPELSNNRAGRSLKPFVTARKNGPLQHAGRGPVQRCDLQPD